MEDRQEQLKNDNWKLKSHDLKTLLGKEITQTAPAALWDLRAFTLINEKVNQTQLIRPLPIPAPL